MAASEPVQSPTARSLILDLLATLRGEAAMPVRALVEAGALFGLAENNVRVSLTRLLRAGQIARDERGRYRLAASAAAIGRHIATWRNAERQKSAWRSDYWAVFRPRGGERGALRREERALRLLGMRPLEGELWVRPANLTLGLDALREQLLDLGLRDEATLLHVQAFDRDQAARALALWDSDALVARYAERIRELDESAERLARLPAEEAMVESFLTGGRALRDLVSDPRLPSPIVPKGALAALVSSMRRYDRLGRDCWAPFLASFGAPHRGRRAPVDFDPLQPAAQALTPVEVR